MISKFTSVIRMGLVATCIVFATQTTQAQVVVNEGFDQANPTSPAVWPAGNLPFGWTQGKIAPSTDANNYWDRMNNPGNNPVCSPRGASLAMLRFRTGYIITAGEQGYVSTKPYDLSGRPAATPSPLSFWVYREGTAGNDNIQVYANNNPDPTVGVPALLQDAGTGQTFIPRPCGTFPADPCGAWTQHTFTIPQNTWSINNLYIIIKVTDAGAPGANVYIEDFAITTYPVAQAFNSISLDVQNMANVGKNTTDNMIIGARIAVTGGIPMTINTFVFTHNGTDAPNADITSAGVGTAKLWWTGGSNQFNPLTAFLAGTYGGLPFPQPTFTINCAGVNLDNGNNYFWLTYNVPAGATSNNHVDADFISAVVGGVTQTCGGIGCSLAGNRLIDVAYCTPTYTAGTSWLNGSYTDNDYVKTAYVVNVGATDPLFVPFYNDHNDAGPSAPVTAGWNPGNQDPCITSVNFINTNGGLSPFSAHPPDYQKFPTASVPKLCAPGPATCTRTTSFLSTSVSPPIYNITVGCGTWFGANYIAAFIDFNHDGTFNNVMYNLPNGEKIFQSTSMAALTFQNGNFTIPNSGIGLPYYGQTTMRVREWYAQPNVDACSPGYYGECEDYTVTIRPDCSPLYPGWKIWLGYTDDWNVATNWCGGVPTINDNALIPGKGAAGFNRGANTYHPVIKSTWLATTRKLIMLNDTVEINAPTAGSLRVSDSLSIGVSTTTNTSALIVDSSYSANAVVSNGVNINTTFLPFRQSFREQRMQLMYKTSELLGFGMQNGDIVDQIIVPIRQRNSTGPYNITIKVYYATNNGTYPNFVNVGYSGVIPANPTVITAPDAGVAGFTPFLQVYSGPVNFTGITPVGAAGNVAITLTTPFKFLTAGTFPLIVDICYSQAVPTSNDQTWQTQTTGFRSVLLLANLAAYSIPGCDVNFNKQAPNGTTLTQRFTTDLRPNLTFVYHRVFDKYPIQMETNGASNGQWANYGNFISGNSIVTFMGTTATTQNIDGLNQTTFNELKINTSGTGNVRLMKVNTTVNDTLWLQNGKLMLNNTTPQPTLLTLNLGDKGAITQQAPNGYLYSEYLPPNYGQVNWKIGAYTGPHVFPFYTTMSGAGYAIPFTYTPQGGTHDLTLGTYYPVTTPPSMIPLPTGVTTINSYTNPVASDAANMVRRYWVMNNTGAAPVADMIFTWALSNNNETPTNTAAPTLFAQRWDPTATPIPGFNSVGPGWWPPIGSGAGQTVTVLGQTKFNSAWVLTRSPEPLPVSLLSFTAKAEKDKVKLNWTTASERNNDYFVVERTTDASSFNFIDKVLSKGPSSSLQEYTTYDYNPVTGLQFYRLEQTDLNGERKASGLVPVTFGKATNFEIVTTVPYDDGSFDVVFNYNSEIPYSYKIVDMVGNIVMEKSNMKGTPGSNLINVKSHIASGVYTIMIYNDQETVAKKIFR